MAKCKTEFGLYTGNVPTQVVGSLISGVFSIVL